MTWAAISATKGLVIIQIKGKIDDPTYCEMLAHDFFDNPHVDLPAHYIFQQDNASPHMCCHTTEFLNIPKYQCPSLATSLLVTLAQLRTSGE